VPHAAAICAIPELLQMTRSAWRITATVCSQSVRPARLMIMPSASCCTNPGEQITLCWRPDKNDRAILSFEQQFSEPGIIVEAPIPKARVAHRSHDDAFRRRRPTPVWQLARHSRGHYTCNPAACCNMADGRLLSLGVGEQRVRNRSGGHAPSRSRCAQMRQGHRW
jgi:hypothetical protein